MSFKLVDLLFRFKTLNGPFTATEKAVLGAMVRHVGDDGGDCWASLETLSAMSGASVSSVQRTIRALIKRDVLTVVRGSAGGAHQTVRYRFLNPKLCQELHDAVERARSHRKANSVTMTELVQELQPSHGDHVSDNGNPVTATENLVTVRQNLVTMTRNMVKVTDESILNQSQESTTNQPPTREDVAGGGQAGSDEQGQEQGKSGEEQPSDEEIERQMSASIRGPFMRALKKHPLPENIRSGITLDGLRKCSADVRHALKDSKELNPFTFLLYPRAWERFLERKDFNGIKKATAWKLFDKELLTDWLPLAVADLRSGKLNRR